MFDPRRLGRKRFAALSTVLAALLAATLTTGPAGTATAASAHRDTHRLPYRDAHLTTAARVADLLGRMTLEEKVGQMTQAERAELTPDASPVSQLALGSILSGGGSVPTPNTPEAWADMVDNFQREALKSRLHIPIIYGVDSVHGHGNLYGATVFPHNIGLGATRDPRLVSDVEHVTADAAIVDATRGIDLSYGTAIEAAFAAEEPVDGDQVSFARVRIRVDVPTAGTYVITHPYGVEVFDVPAAGRRAINMTRDIGIAGAGDFTGALKGDVGPFLRSVNGPYTEGSERFIGDPNLEERVTGSPFNTNFVRIEGPNGIDLRTELFAVSGKLSTVNLPTPLLPQRSTYSRHTENGDLRAQQDKDEHAHDESGGQHIFVELLGFAGFHPEAQGLLVA